MSEETPDLSSAQRKEIVDQITDGIAKRLSTQKAVIINQLSTADDHRDGLARDSLAAARSFGSDAIRAAFIINGGALTALLAYLGSENATQSGLQMPMLLFALGAIFAVFSAVWAYLAQSSLADQYRGWKKDAAYPKSAWSTSAVAFLAVSACLSAAGAVATFCELKDGAQRERTMLEIKVTSS